MIKKLNLIALFLVLTVFITCTRSLSAFEITSDPQYVVINFANFYFYNWQAPEKEWTDEIKPKIKQKLREMRTLLTVGTKNRVLAWSTLLEYMNFPMDTPDENSPYIVQAKRIMEIAEEENFPVFMPLNGVQWWDELPELWNYWDFDGNRTPGCTNDDFKNCKFKKLQNPEYRKRFISGYSKDNQWNVDWEDWETPMKFNTRNWGGGDIFVAPPPNLVDHNKSKLSFKKVQTERFKAIVDAISDKLNIWQKAGKQNLFAGISIGTEVSLNASIVPGDQNFKPFAYRGIQDMFCPKTDPTCGKIQNWKKEELNTMREKIIFNYFNSLSRIASTKGLPKPRIYTHVWSEALPDEQKYTNAIGASITLFSRPGMSLYGKATDPLGFTLLKNTLQDNGYPGWGAPEFSPLINDSENWNKALINTLSSKIAPAKIIDIYNEREILGTAAIPALQQIMKSEAPKTDCSISETIVLTPDKTINPESLSWKNLTENDSGDNLTLFFWKNYAPVTLSEYKKTAKLDAVQNNYLIKQDEWDDGLYYWVIQRKGCHDEKWTTSTPHYFIIKKPIADSSPWWVKFILSLPFAS